MGNMRKYSLLLIVILCQVVVSHAQLSNGGLPYSFDSKTVSQSFHEVYISSPDYDKIAQEDELTDNNRFAVLLPVDYNTSNSGTWEWLADGSRVWRFKITLETSLAISLYFKDFSLPEGALMYLYDENQEQVKGAFTSLNNRSNGLFATEMIIGEHAIIELFVPAGIPEKSFFTISEVSYSYRFIGANKATASGFCEVNINCSPEGDDWQNEKYGIVRIKVKIAGGLFWCSGSLVNNIREDKTPYVLSADHCAYKFSRYATPDEVAQWLFDFNLEGADCDAYSTSDENFTLIGAEKIAQGGNHGTEGSDFYLVKLIDSIPEDSYVVYNGWDANDNSSDFGVCIHHPGGDIKKISYYTEPITTSGWYGNGLFSHWEVYWSETENGWGVTEGGSSGSPLFDVNGRIIGTLTGGQASCSNPEEPDYYGKFSYHWSSNGDHDTLQLKPWLDPDDTGITFMGGTIRDTIQIEEPPTTDVKIEPNPVFDNLLTFKFENTTLQKANLTISDLSGSIIFEREVSIINNTYIMDIRYLPNGFYVAIIDLGGILFEKKFIKQ